MVSENEHHTESDTGSQRLCHKGKSHSAGLKVGETQTPELADTIRCENLGSAAGTGCLESRVRSSEPSPGRSEEANQRMAQLLGPEDTHERKEGRKMWWWKDNRGVSSQLSRSVFPSSRAQTPVPTH